MRTVKLAGIALALLSAATAGALFVTGKILDSKTGALLKHIEDEIPGLRLKITPGESSLLSRSGRLFYTYKQNAPGAWWSPLEGALDYKYSLSLGGVDGTFTRAADFGNLDKLAARLCLEPLHFTGDFAVNPYTLSLDARVHIDPLSLNTPEYQCKTTAGVLELRSGSPGVLDSVISTAAVNCRTSPGALMELKELRISAAPELQKLGELPELQIAYKSMNLEKDLRVPVAPPEPQSPAATQNPPQPQATAGAPATAALSPAGSGQTAADAQNTSGQQATAGELSTAEQQSEDGGAQTAAAVQNTPGQQSTAAGEPGTGEPQAPDGNRTAAAAKNASGQQSPEWQQNTTETLSGDGGGQTAAAAQNQAGQQLPAVPQQAAATPVAATPAAVPPASQPPAFITRRISYHITDSDYILGIKDRDSSGFGVLYSSGTTGSFRQSIKDAPALPEYRNYRYDLSLEKINPGKLAELAGTYGPDLTPEKLRPALSPDIRLNIKKLHLEHGADMLEVEGSLENTPGKPGAEGLKADLRISAGEKFLKSFLTDSQQLTEEQYQSIMNWLVSKEAASFSSGVYQTRIEMKDGHYTFNGKSLGK